MSKKVKTIIIGAAVLVLLAALLVVLYLTRGENPNGDPTISYAENEYVSIYKGNDDDIVEVRVKNQIDEYVIERVAEEVWGIKDIIDFKQNKTAFNDVINDVVEVVASSKVVENCEDLAQYGLDKPELTFEVVFKDKSYKFEIGDVSPDGGARYGMVDGVKTVYTFATTKFKTLFLDRYSYIDKLVIEGLKSDKMEDIPIINEMSISRPDLEKPIAIKKYADGELPENAAMQSYFYMTSPVKALTDETAAQTYVFGHFGLFAENVVKAKPTPAELTEFGFDEPSSVFEMRYNDNSHVKITTGASIDCQHEAGEDLTGHVHKPEFYYAMSEGIDQVYVIKAESMIWMKMQPKDILSTSVLLPALINVESMDITLEGKEHKLEFIRGEDKTDIKQFTSKLDGKEVNISNAKFYMQLCMLTSAQDIYTGEDFADAAKVKIVYNYLAGGSDTLEAYLLKDMTCVLAVNGEKSFVGRAGYIDKLIKEMQNLLTDQKVDIDW